jgi:hypothetical protein
MGDVEDELNLILSTKLLSVAVLESFLFVFNSCFMIVIQRL